MEKEGAIEKLKELGIETQNFFDKRTYVWKDDICVGIFPVEAKKEDAFYFSVNGEEKLYMLPQQTILDSPIDQHFGKDKYQVPLKQAQLLWEDKPFEEVPDLPFNKLTVRMFYAMLQNKPVSNVDWLDTLIRKNQ